MNERKSYFFIWYNKPDDNLGPFYELSSSRAKKNIQQVNFKNKKEDIMVYMPEGSNTQYYLAIPESSPYFNLPLLITKMIKEPGVESNLRNVARQVVDKIIK